VAHRVCHARESWFVWYSILGGMYLLVCIMIGDSWEETRSQLWPKPGLWLGGASSWERAVQPVISCVPHRLLGIGV